jgi:hypothetical protein
VKLRSRDLPCRMLTQDEVSQVALELAMDRRVIESHMRDPMYCVWHEEEVATLEELISKARTAGWFMYCSLLPEPQGLYTDPNFSEAKRLCYHGEVL